MSLGACGMLSSRDQLILATTFPRLHPVDLQAALPPNQCTAIALLSASLSTHGAVTLIDVTLAAHNRQHGGPEFSVGAAAILRAREKHDMYNRTFDFSSDAVQLEVFAVETSGALHREGRQFSVLMNPLMKGTKGAVSRNDDTLRTCSLNSNR